MKAFSAFLDTRRWKNWAHKIFSWKYLIIWRPVLPVFPRAENASFLIATLNPFQGLLKVSSCSSSWFNPCGGRWQVPICSWQTSCFNFKFLTQDHDIVSIRQASVTTAVMETELHRHQGNQDAVLAIGNPRRQMHHITRSCYSSRGGRAWRQERMMGTHCTHAKRKNNLGWIPRFLTLKLPCEKQEVRIHT